MSAWMVRLGHVDERILNALVLRRGRILDRLMGGVTRLADPAVAVLLATALALGVVPGLREAGQLALVTLATSHLLVQILKRWVDRPRPDLPVGLDSLVAVPDRFSFPSGHAAAGLSVFLPLAAALPLPGALVVIALAFLVGLSRCYLGVHYPGDVVVGWGLAAACMAWPAPLVLALV